MSSENGKLLVITGPSGVGKTTLTSELVERTDVQYSVSVTTRSPRPGELDGRDYHFIDMAEFDRLKDQDQLLEYAEVFGCYYGTPRLPVQAAIDGGKTVLLEIDVQGGLQVYERMPEACFVLIVPPDIDELRSRLLTRNTEDSETLSRRLGKAEREIKQARESGIYKHEIINDDVQVAVQELLKVIDCHMNTKTQERYIT